MEKIVKLKSYKPFYLLLIIFLFFPFGFTTDDRKISLEEMTFDDFTIWDFYIPELPTYDPKRQAMRSLQFFCNLQNDAGVTETEVTIRVMTTTSLGYYFITAYCPSECGWNGDPDNLAGWITASGEICHRAEWEKRYSEPTTCAISRSIHSFGELFYIEEFDRVFISEDTGSAVNGKHLDLFYEDYDDVLSFPTGYYEVHSVEFEEYTFYMIDYPDVIRNENERQTIIKRVMTEDEFNSFIGGE